MRIGPGTFAFLVFLAISSAAWAAEEGRPARLPRPSAAALAASERAVREIFDADLARAVKPREKAAAARRILDVALDTPDGDRNADRFAAFVLARETALAGRDKATAFAASRAIAERYEQPCEGNPLAKGDELWKAASAKLGAERLRIEAEAAEWYGYALAELKEGDFTRKLIEKRLTVEDAGAVAARPNNKKIEKDADLKLLIGTWDVKVKKARAVWTFCDDHRIIARMLGETSNFTGTWTATPDKILIHWDRNPEALETFRRPINSQWLIGDSLAHGNGVVEATKRDNVK